MRGARKGLRGGIGFAERLELSKRNVRLLEEQARILITIAPDNARYAIRQNPNGQLNIVAVLGPVANSQLEKQLLLEIGMGRTRPYAETEEYRKGKGGRRYRLPQRQKIFSLTEAQYCLVAPEIFGLLRQIAEEKVRAWRSGSHFWLNVSRTVYDAKEKREYTTSRTSPWPKGIRFSFDKRDHYIVRDLVWSELNGEQISHILSGKARYIRLLFYRRNKKYFKNGLSARHLGTEFAAIADLPMYLKEELADYLFSGPNNYGFLDQLAWFLPLPRKKTSPEQQLAASAFPDPESRIGKINVRITSGLENKKNYVVAEIIPFLYPFALESDFKKLYNDEVPF